MFTVCVHDMNGDPARPTPPDNEAPLRALQPLRQLFTVTMKSRDVLMDHVMVTIPEVLDGAALNRSPSDDSLQQHPVAQSEDEACAAAEEEDREDRETDDLESDDSSKVPAATATATVAAAAAVTAAVVTSAAVPRVKRLQAPPWGVSSSDRPSRR